MPTQEKQANHTAELEEHLSALEQQRRLAGEAVTGAARRIEEIAARQQEIAVAVVSGDEGAIAENEQLEKTLLIENNRRKTARSAAEQLDQQIAQAKEALAGAKREGHRQRAADLARERYALEARAEANMDALLGTLTELATLDGRQRRQRHLAGREQAHAEHPLDRTLYDWLSARLGGVHGYLGLSISPGTEGRPLYELDALAVAPKRL
jgi:chromosome segregation ATPase